MAHDQAQLRPCRFCGSADFLQVRTQYASWLAYDGDALKLDPDGGLGEQMFDAVECHSCCAVAPLEVWQAEGPIFNPAQIAAYAAYLAETGQVLEAA